MSTTAAGEPVPLYSDEWIALAVFGIANNTRISTSERHDITKQLFHHMRDRYEAELDALRAKVEAQAWQPTGWHNFSDPNGEGFVIVSGGGRTIGMYEDDDTGMSGWAITLPKDFALCRRTPPVQPASDGAAPVGGGGQDGTTP